MIFSVNWVLQSLQILVDVSQVGNTFSNNFFVVVRASSLLQMKASTHPEKHTHNKNILIMHTKWQLNEVQLKCTTVDEGVYLKNAKELGRTKWPSWVSHCPDYSFNFQPLFIHLNFSGSGVDCCNVTGTWG